LRVPRRAILLPQDPRRVPRDSAMNRFFWGDGFSATQFRLTMPGGGAQRAPHAASLASFS
ncbi:hypothetical protein QMA70_32335, partial [Burkholderia pseudomallei]